MQTYSTIMVIDSLLKSEEINSTIDKITRSIENNGGEILENDRWGKKRLAYEIKKRQYGYYVEIIFKAMGDLIKIIEREYRLDENILRYLTIVLDKKALQYRQKEEKKRTVKTEKNNNAVNEEKKPNIEVLNETLKPEEKKTEVVLN